MIIAAGEVMVEPTVRAVLQGMHLPPQWSVPLVAAARVFMQCSRTSGTSGPTTQQIMQEQIV